MSIFDHKSRSAEIKSFYRLLSNIDDLQKLGQKYGINDIFQDNGAKILQTLIFVGLEPTLKRAGNDAHDLEHEYELKTANKKLVNSFSTHHHLNKKILNKYRKVIWLFSIYEDIELKEIWLLHPKQLEPYFEKWEFKLGTSSHINNPKVPFSFVRKRGIEILTEQECDAYKADSLGLNCK